MATATNFCKSGSTIDDHDAQPARVRVQLLFIQHDSGRQVPLFPSTHNRNIGDQILLRQIMTATDDLFKSLAAAHDFDDQSTGMLIPFELVEDIAFLQSHISPMPSLLLKQSASVVPCLSRSGFAQAGRFESILTKH